MSIQVTSASARGEKRLLDVITTVAKTFKSYSLTAREFPFKEWFIKRPVPAFSVIKPPRWLEANGAQIAFFVGMPSKSGSALPAKAVLSIANGMGNGLVKVSMVRDLTPPTTSSLRVGLIISGHKENFISILSVVNAAGVILGTSSEVLDL